MTLTMAFIGMFWMFVSGVFLGRHIERSIKSKTLFSVDKVVLALQLKLIMDKDKRGFQTRSHVSKWLKNMVPEVKEDLERGRKTR